MEDCKEAATPVATNCLMDADEAENQVDSTKYRGLIGSMLYLTASRPDTQFGVCLCARFQSNPKESHFKAAKWILKYLKGQLMLDYGILMNLTLFLVVFHILTM